MRSREHTTAEQQSPTNVSISRPSSYGADSAQGDRNGFDVEAYHEEVEVEVEVAPSIITVGLVRAGWHLLFIETCKLLYALYSDDCENRLLPVLDVTLLYNLLMDVILTPIPSFEIFPGDSDLQITCRRHALQLAMLSLDLPANGELPSTANTDSSMHLIVQKLQARDGIRILCAILDDYFATGGTTLDSENNVVTTTLAPVVTLSPILVLLTKVATSSAEGRAELKAIIFPNAWRSEEDEGGEVGPDSFQQKMDPTDIPSGTLRASLIGMMTSLDSVLKRYCAELLYTLCDKESDEFVVRTGFGNAVALMQIKGLI